MGSMLWKIAAVLAGLAVVGAATHANVLHAGGYGTSDAWLIMTVAALLAIGMGYAVIAWKDGHKAGAILLGLCLVAGEVYWLATNAEREIAKREADAAPLRDALSKRARAEQKAMEAKAAVATAGAVAQSRVTSAEAAKAAAELAAVTEAAKPGCRKNCADLLRDAKDRADRDVREARAALDSATAKAEQEARNAQAALEAMPAAPSAAPLSERLGLASWAWDLIMAGLRSLAVVGGSIAVALALHPRRAEPEATTAAVTAAKPAALTPNATPRNTETAPLQLAPPASSQQHVAQFLFDVLCPDPTGSEPAERLYLKYLEWCEVMGTPPLPPVALGREMRSLVKGTSLRLVESGETVVLKGAAIAA